jgi:ComF family protein
MNLDAAEWLAMSSWLSRIATLARGLEHLLYPGHCLLCGRALPRLGAHFCEACAEGLLVDPWPSCPRCAGTVGPFAVLDGGCAACRQEPYFFDQALRLGPYRTTGGPLHDAVLRIKHYSGEGLAELLGEYWARRDSQRLLQLGANAVVAVPLHWLRRWQRGYHQSAALAWGLSSRLGWPCRPGWLRRVRNTPTQKGRDAEQRRANVRDAFRTRRGLRLDGQTILLVDDVMTTGATASEAARALKEAGAACVVVAALGRAGTAGPAAQAQGGVGLPTG